MATATRITEQEQELLKAFRALLEVDRIALVLLTQEWAGIAAARKSATRRRKAA